MGLISGYTSNELEMGDEEDVFFQAQEKVDFQCREVNLDEKYGRLNLTCEVKNTDHKGKYVTVGVTLEHKSSKFLRNIERQFGKEFFTPEQLTAGNVDFSSIVGCTFTAEALEVYEKQGEGKNAGKVFRSQTFHNFVKTGKSETDDIPF